jgi:hypothetical protein
MSAVASGIVEREMQAIYGEYGELVADTVLEWAQPVTAPLHSFFDWDDAKAGHEHRLEQARRLIRSVKVTYKLDEEGRNKRVRRYHSVPAGDEQRLVYRDLDEILDDPFQRQLLLRQMERDWKAFRARYEHLLEYDDMITAAAVGSLGMGRAPVG